MSPDGPASQAPLDLDGDARRRLAGLADALITGGDGFPAPSEIGVGDVWIDDAVRAMPVSAAAVAAVLERPGDPGEVLAALMEDEPGTFMAFAQVVSGAYLMHPRVRRALGYTGPAPAPNPAMDGEAEYFLEGGILDPVIERGPIYVEVGDDARADA